MRINRSHHIMAKLTAVLIAVLLLAPTVSVPQATAVYGGRVEQTRAGQVQIFENGGAVGGGTIIHPQWVLTALTTVQNLANLPAYTMRLGGFDLNDPQEMRQVDRIVPHPHADLALVHLTVAAPANTWLPEIAAGQPLTGMPAFAYGWGATHGIYLDSVRTMIYDPAATANALSLRSTNNGMAWGFPDDAPPLVLDAATSPDNNLDIGGGTLIIPGILVGIHAGTATYRTPAPNGTLYPGLHTLMYDQPIWRYRDWIRATIDGEGSSGSSLTDHDELRRRRLLITPDNPSGPNDSNAASEALPVTLPPLRDTDCRPSIPCASTTAWTVATLTSPTDVNTGVGLVAAACATPGGTCRFDGKRYPEGAIDQLRLDRMNTGSGSGSGSGFGADTDARVRNIMVWCATSTTLKPNEPPVPVYRTSFLNNDPPNGPNGPDGPDGPDRLDNFEGHGLWDVPQTNVTHPDTADAAHVPRIDVTPC